VVHHEASVHHATKELGPSRVNSDHASRRHDPTLYRANT
jgi:hypothetical protein